MTDRWSSQLVEGRCYCFYGHFRKDGPDIWVLPTLSEGRQADPAGCHRIQRMRTATSPDGRWIAYTAERPAPKPMSGQPPGAPMRLTKVSRVYGSQFSPTLACRRRATVLSRPGYKISGGGRQRPFRVPAGNAGRLFAAPSPLTTAGWSLVRWAIGSSSSRRPMAANRRHTEWSNWQPH
jgi:hypothetical protein